MRVMTHKKRDDPVRWLPANFSTVGDRQHYSQWRNDRIIAANYGTEMATDS